MGIVKEIETYAGQHVKRAAGNMIAALGESKRVKCRFNDIVLIADRDSTVDSIVADYQEKCEERARRYRESPEGKAAVAAAEAKRAALQQTADRLMGELPHLNFNDAEAVLSWLCDMEEPRDHSGVKVDYPRMLHEFCRHGWEPDACVGPEFDENDKWNFAAWIVGQAIKAVYVPMTRHFTEQWRARFAGK